jgi:hypothetical protein
VFHPLILPTIALIVFGGTEYFGAKKTIPFGFEGPVINGFRFFYFTVRPFVDLLRRGQSQPDTEISSWIGGFSEEIVYGFQILLLVFDFPIKGFLLTQ